MIAFFFYHPVFISLYFFDCFLSVDTHKLLNNLVTTFWYSDLLSYHQRLRFCDQCLETDGSK